MLLSLETVVFGAIAGLALGLTGGGGATVAVPLLVYGLGVPVPQAVAISLLAVGVAALAGFWNRARRSDVDLGAGAMLAGGGVAAAPFGAWLGARIPATLVLAAFGVIVVVVGVRMWLTANRPTDLLLGPCAIRQRISWRCISVLSTTGVTTGLLSGIFGVGGGFVVVPAIVFATGTSIHRAVATSLMVTSIVAGSGFVSMVAHGRHVPWDTAFTFLMGALLGMAAGTKMSARIPGPQLKRTFAVLLGALGAFVMMESLRGG